MSNMMKNVATKMLCVYLFIMHSSTGSLTSWYFYAQTSCLSDAGTDSSSTYVTLMYEANGSPSNIKEDKQYLYDLSGNDNEQCKGSMWKFEAPEDFISPHNYKSLSISTDSSDGWNIEMDFAITADNTTGKLFLLAYDGEIYQWLDTDNGRREASLGRDRLACKVANQCITQFIIVGYTGDVSDAGSDDSFAFKLEKYGVGIETPLYERDGDDFESNHGDVWYISPDSFGYSGCVKFKSITKASFVATGSDGWYISDAFVIVKLASDSYALLAGNIALNKWVEGDGNPTASLTMYNRCVDLL